MAPAATDPPPPDLSDELRQRLAPLRELLHGSNPNAVVPFVGSGLSRGLKSWTALFDELVNFLPPVDQPGVRASLIRGKYLDVAGLLEGSPSAGPARIQAAIVRDFQEPKAPEPPIYAEVARLPTRHFLTTNYDPWLKNAVCRRLGKVPNLLLPSDGASLGHLDGERAWVFHLHGDADKPDTCVLTARAYRRLLSGAPAWRRAVQSLLSNRHLLFLGTSLSEPHLDVLLGEFEETFQAKGGLRRHWWLGRSTNVVERHRLEALGIEVVDYDDHSLLSPILAWLAQPEPTTSHTPRHAPAALGAFSWLHLTDLHFGLRGQRHLWPNLRGPFLEDLAALHGRCGPWDAVFFTGDLTQQGEADEFAKMQTEVLDRVWEKLTELGSGDAVLLAVPGNHDLCRPSPKAPAARLLINSFDAIAEEFWEEPAGAYRAVVTDAFAAYTKWWQGAPRRPAELTPGLLPGDFAVTLDRRGRKIGVVGLNTAFLQLAGGDYTERLVWDTRQLDAVCGGAADDWTKKHDLCLLLTHHGPSWLTPAARQHGDTEIAPPGRFALHLYGHMHATEMLTQHRGGDPRAVRRWQGLSLFGMEHYGEPPTQHRAHGFTAGRVDFGGEHPNARCWPRRATNKPAGWRLIPNQEAAHLIEDEGTHPETLIRTLPRRSTAPAAAAPPPAPINLVVRDFAWAAPFERGVPRPAFNQPVLPATVTGPSGALRPPPDGPPINAGPASTLPPSPVAAGPAPTLPLPLVAAHKARRLVPFVGAGLSLGPDVGGGFPTWRALPGRLLEACELHCVWADPRDGLTLRARFLEPDPADPGRERPRPMPLDEMLRQLDQVKDKLGHDYPAALTAIFRPRDARPGAAHAAVMALDALAVLTSNYDLLLEAADPDPARQRYTHRQATTALSDLRDGRPVLFKVHGSAEDHESVVLTLDEYRAAHADRKYQAVMRLLLADRSFLFVGYGMSDPHDLDVLLAESVTDLKGSTPLHFALLPRLAHEQDEVDRRVKLRREHRVVVIPYDDRDGHREATDLLRALAAAP